MATVVSVNLSVSKGTPKEPMPEIELRQNYGVVGDAHAGSGDRQVSLLALESYQRFEMHKDVCLKHGSFGENIVTRGIELHTLPIGTRLMINGAVLQISKIGKECHAPCAIKRKMGSCIMPREGIFARVLRAGMVRPGSKILQIT